MICEGNIQQYSFYIFGEFTLFFSVDHRHKMVNVFISYFFFFIVLSSIAAYFWCWKCYKKNIKYFIENAQSNFEGIFSYTVSNGLICMAFGAVHQLFHYAPNLQLLALCLVQAVWICLQIRLISGYRAYKTKIFVCFNIVEGIFRMIFQLSLYIFDKGSKNPLDASFLNS